VRSATSLETVIGLLRESMADAGIASLTITPTEVLVVNSDNWVHPATLLRRWRESHGYSRVELGKLLGYKISPHPQRVTASICPSMVAIENYRCLVSKSRREQCEELTGIPAEAWDVAAYKGKPVKKIKLRSKKPRSS
jgi:hypothetical protein